VGGETTICLGAEDCAQASDQQSTTARGPVGGPATIILGGDDSQADFLERQAERAAAIETPAAAPRHQQAPGGNSTVCLDTSAKPGDIVPVATRGVGGGVATVILGVDNFEEILNQRQQEREVCVETPASKPRVSQAPGGTSSISLESNVGSVQEETKKTGCPVGGASAVILGVDDTREIFRQHEADCRQLLETPAAPVRFQQAPGGDSSVYLGEGAVDEGTAVAVRGPVGGASAVVLGSDSVQWQSRQEQVCTPEANPRFQQEPGGNTSICLGTYGLPGDGNVVADATRGPVGGPGHIVLGSDDNKAIFKQLEKLREAPVNTPSAAPRFSQAPGGNAAIKLEPSDTQADDVPAVRGPVGGETTLSLGGSYPDDMLQKATNVLKDGASSNRFANGANQNSGNVITDRPTTRLHFAPGGASTICLGSDDADKATNVLKERASANRFANGANQNCGNVITDRPTTRLHFAPGGASTICLGNDDPDIPAKATLSVAASKLSAVVTDENTSTENVAQNQDAKDAVKRGALIHGKQAPGGVATVVLG